jgi:two-component system cell cycle response regulator DivK
MVEQMTMLVNRAFEAATARPGARRKRVLIVEDNALNMRLFSAMVASQGYDVLEAQDGVAGIAMAHRQHPDLIIMDIQLPGISGLQAMEALKADADTSDIPIIATTAYASGGDEQKLRASGCDGYMAKPIAVSEFLRLVDALVLQRRPVASLVA